MEILALTSSYPRFEGDPTAPFIESITQAIAARGHVVHLVLPAHREWRRNRVENGIHYHPYRYSPRREWTPWGYSASLEDGVRIRPSLYALAPAVVLAAFRMASRLATRIDFDLVHVHWVIPNGPVGALVAARHRLPLVVSLHGSDVSVAQRSRTLSMLARRTFARAAAVTAPSADLLERAEALGATSPLELIHYGADASAFSPSSEVRRSTRARLGLADGDVTILGVGRFVQMKGFDTLIQAFARTVATIPEARLVLVGDGDLRGELEELVRELRLDERVIFTGMASRGEVGGFFSAADIVIVPSIHHSGHVDGLPNVALEAMAAGKPLIATRVGGLPQVIRDGENGLLVDERDPAGLADAIIRLSADAHLCARISAEARSLIDSTLNWESVAQRLETVFEAVLETRKTKPRVQPAGADASRIENRP